MFELSPDTSSEAAAVQRRIWRDMPAERRLHLVLDFSSAIRRIALEGVRRRHPEYDERRLKLAWLQKTMEPKAFQQIFPGEDVPW